MSSHGAYDEPERGRTFTVVLLALLILTVIGTLFGFVLGRRANGDTTSGAGDRQSPGPSTTVTTQGAPTVAALPCPQFTGDAVKSRDPKAALPLTLAFYVRTDKREAWVCRETNGNLWYQGHDKNKDFYNNGNGETPKQGDNGLLLDTVTFAGSATNDKYVASNGTTQYTLTRDKLVVTGNQSINEDVRESLPKK